jgi:cystathionine beta-lyase/cystathionine gamma-synthase
MENMERRLSDIINKLGEERDLYFNAVSPPIIQSSNFCYPTVAKMREALSNEFEIPVYTRGMNPTVNILRKKMAALEGTEDALITSSGCAAISYAVIANLSQGDHVVCVRKPYSWANTLFNIFLTRFGIGTTMIDGRDPENFRKAMRKNTRLFYLESPNTFTFELQDLAAVSAIARQNGIKTVIDNSYNTPLHQRPAGFGIDIVVHTATKYLAGHSDVVAGVICGREEMIRKIFSTEQMTLGGVISPHDAWLMIRGLRTLPLRLKQSSESARQIIQSLEGHPKVERILWPFHPSFEQADLAKRQMIGCSGLFSVLLKTPSPGNIERFCNSLRRFLLAVSWGGFESLVFPALTFNGVNEEKSEEIPGNLVRFYIGLEDPADLIEDIENALKNL